MECQGNETGVANCSYSTVGNCQHSEDAGVRCSGMIAVRTEFAIEFADIENFDNEAQILLKTFQLYSTSESSSSLQCCISQLDQY